ncbi:type II secretion system F family protein [bacterium]|nr:type II secretion system F family protein [bacterium]
MTRWLRLTSFSLLCLAGLLGVISLLQGEQGDSWSSAMLFTLAAAFLVQLPGVVTGTLVPLIKRSSLPTRPRQGSQSLLQAPTQWSKFYRLFASWWAICLLLALLDSEWAAVLALIPLPLLPVLVLWNLVHPGPGSERRLLAEQLASGLEAEIPLSELLEQLRSDALSISSTRIGALPVVLDWLAFDLRCGAQFSTAVASQSYFPPIWSRLLAAGERSGRLPECLKVLARLEANQPRRAHLLRPLLSLPIIVLLALLTKQVTLGDMGRPGSHSTLPFTILLAVFLALGIFSLSAPWLRAKGGWLALRDRLQSLPWIWPLARQEEQLMPITALLAGIRLNCDSGELVELARVACSHSRFKNSLDPQRALAGDQLAQILSSAFSPEVVALVAYGEAHSQLEASLEAAQGYLEGRLAEERLRLERRYLQAFQILTGLLVFACALGAYIPLESLYLSILQEGL